MAKRRRRKKPVVPVHRISTPLYMRRHFWLYLMLLPGLIYFIMFRYVPMGGLVIAFKDYSPFRGIANSPWVGLQQFQKFFETPDFFRLLRNTLGINLLQLVLYFPAPIILALLMNEVRHSAYKRLYKRWFTYWCGLMFIAAIIWNWFKLAGRGLTKVNDV